MPSRSSDRDCDPFSYTNAGPPSPATLVTLKKKGLPSVGLSSSQVAYDEDGNVPFRDLDPSQGRGSQLAGNGSSSVNGSGGPWTVEASRESSPADEDDDDYEGRASFPPSLTTGSSASIESLESVRSSYQRNMLLQQMAAMNGQTDATRGVEKALAMAASAQAQIAGLPGNNGYQNGKKNGGQQLPTSHDSSADGTSLLHSEFGFCTNQAYRYTSQHPPGAPLPNPDEEEPSYWVVLTTYISYLILIIIGHMRDYVGKRVFPKAYRHLVETQGYAALNSDFDSFYTRRLKARLDDCFSRPVTGVCGRTVLCLDRVTDDFNASFRLTGDKTRALNISAYNYLGFAQSHGGCADAVEECLKRYSVSSFGSRLGAGSLDLQAQAEKLVAKFVGMEDSVIISMGFATNSTTIPAIASPGTLIISDEYNHSSIRFGARLSGAHIRQYKHNDMKELENLLRECISQGMPRTHRPWKKILLIVEGLYSMEGTLVNLPEVMRLKDKYKVRTEPSSEIDDTHADSSRAAN